MKGIAMAATATILQVYCVKEASGTDLGPITAQLATALSGLWPVLTGGFQPSDAVRAVPGLIEMLDSVRTDPDDLYITTLTSGGLSNAIWPLGGTTMPMQQGQSQFPNISVPIPFFGQNISLWDYDTSSADDLLASIPMFEAERAMGVISKLGRSVIENSAYYITYRVD
jgi:hypothetical protein